MRNAGKSAARSCTAKLVKILDTDGQEIKEFDPTQLHWVTTSWHEVPFKNVDLNPGDYEYLDFLETQAKDDKVYLGGDQHPWAKYQQRAITSSLLPGRYILNVTVYGDNVEPITKYVSIIWGGSNIKNISVGLHDSIRQAKSHLK